MISDQHAICSQIPNPAMIIINNKHCGYNRAMHEKLSIVNREFAQILIAFVEFRMKWRLMASSLRISQHLMEVFT